MKKFTVLFLALTLFFGAQAQFGNLGGAIRRSAQKNVEKKVEEKAKQKAEQEVDKALDKAFGLDENNKQSADKSSKSTESSAAEEALNNGKIPTPEEVMSSVPALPSDKNIASYLCEQSREEPNPFKLMGNPTTTFLTKMAIAAASGAVTMMSTSGSGHILYYDEELLKELGIDEKQYENMSEAEKEELATKYAAELQERYIRTAEVLGNDKRYAELLDRYNAIEDEINALYTKADESCKAMWEGTYAKDNNLCDYYANAVPEYHKAVTQAMKIRKSRQLDIAKTMDKYVQKLAEEHRGEVYAGFYNQGGLCATSYVGDAARLVAISDPR